jgi:hypothetical protein
MKKLLFALLLVSSSAGAQTFGVVPYVFVNGAQYIPSQVMADFQSMANQGNAVAAGINSAIAAVTPPPSGAILHFNLTSCPSGWTSLGASYIGRSVRGLDQGRGQDPGNTLAGLEGATMTDHTHVVTGNLIDSVTETNIVAGGATSIVVSTLGTPPANPLTGNDTGARTGASVLASNVALLLCQKN